MSAKFLLQQLKLSLGPCQFPFLDSNVVESLFPFQLKEFKIIC